MISASAGARDDAGPGALVERLFRRESRRLVATLVASLGSAHLALAEDAVQDALVAALRTWPLQGTPERPAAWLQAVARHRAVDRLRREARGIIVHDARAAARAQDAMTHAPAPQPQDDARYDHELSDEQVRLLFLCCHPSLSADAQACLMLKLVCGLGVRAIARAFLVDPAAISQRLVRAKARLIERGARLELPDSAALPARAGMVRAVLYLAFNEGYASAEGDAMVRDDVCAEALRLAELSTRESLLAGPESNALAALLCLQASRLPARLDRNGNLVRLADQDRALWDRRLIARGFAHLDAACEGEAETRFHLEAAIAAEHASAPSAGRTNWAGILALYDRLAALTGSPLVRLHRAVALAEVIGPGAALRELEALGRSRNLERYHLLHAVRGEMLARSGRLDEARQAFATGAGLPCSRPEREYLERRATAG